MNRIYLKQMDVQRENELSVRPSVVGCQEKMMFHQR